MIIFVVKFFRVWLFLFDDFLILFIVFCKVEVELEKFCCMVVKFWVVFDNFLGNWFCWNVLDVFLNFFIVGFILLVIIFWKLLIIDLNLFVVLDIVLEDLVNFV